MCFIVDPFGVVSDCDQELGCDFNDLAFDRLSGTYSGPLPAQHHQAAVWQPGQLTLLAGSPGHAQELLVDAHVAAALLTALLVAKADTSVARALTLLHRAGSGERPAARAGIR